MKRGMHRFFVVPIFLLAGCAGAPLAIDKTASPQKIANDVGVSVESTTTLVRCNAADAVPGDKLAVFQPCLYVALADGAVLVGFDEGTQSYRLLRRLDPNTVRAIAMKQMGRAKQIQIHGDTGFAVFDLLSDDRMWGNPSASAAAYDHLRSLGIPSTEPVQLVANYHPIRVEVNRQ